MTSDNKGLLRHFKIYLIYNRNVNVPIFNFVDVNECRAPTVNCPGLCINSYGSFLCIRVSFGPSYGETNIDIFNKLLKIHLFKPTFGELC